MPSTGDQTGSSESSIQRKEREKRRRTGRREYDSGVNKEVWQRSRDFREEGSLEVEELVVGRRR